jgi:[acyl-carrier-protein] S-malonyltransferase
MRPAAERLKEHLQKVNIESPEITLVNNVDVRVEREPAAIRDALARQAASPVRWVETVRKMVAMGATHIVECGPGRVLAGMTKRNDPSVQSLTLADRAALEQALQGVKA